MALLAASALFSSFVGEAAGASSTTYTDYLVGTSGYVDAAVGDRFTIKRDFINGSLQNTLWDTASADLVFDHQNLSSTTHVFALAGSDRGSFQLGFRENFAWRKLTLRSGDSLRLEDGNGTPGAAFYVRRLLLQDGIAQIPRITSNGANIYYDPLDNLNAYLGGRTYALSPPNSMTDGGAILPARIDLRIAPALAPGAIAIQGVAIPGVQYVVEASTDLFNWAPLGTLTAAADGTFQYADPAAGTFDRRFYRLKLAPGN